MYIHLLSYTGLLIRMCTIYVRKLATLQRVLLNYAKSLFALLCTYVYNERIELIRALTQQSKIKQGNFVPQTRLSGDPRV